MNKKESAAARIALYLILLVLPLVIVTSNNLPPPDLLAYNLGRAFALAAFVILALQFPLAARLGWVERPFGLNLVLPFHRNMAVLAGLLLLVHPFLMAWGGGGWKLLLADPTWYIWVGRGALALLLLSVVISVGRKRLGVPFETWRLGHNISGPAILVLGFVHSWYASVDFTLTMMQLLWLALLAQAAAFYLEHRIFTPARLRRNPYQVIEVHQENHNVWTLKLAPPAGQARFDFLPGQFQFITLLRGRGLPEEEHHFTIASSPAEPDGVSATIKASGDFTATIGETRPGDLAVIQAPFGRFSYLLHPEAKDLVFIAGGIGITPFLSNLRHMRDVRAERRVLLLWANRTEADIICREELAALEAGERPEVKVVHILSRPEAGWEGERGRLDRLSLQRLAGERLSQSQVFLCCPPPLTQSLLRALAALGVPEKRISLEYFSL